jgi:hypothetical protein
MVHGEERESALVADTDLRALTESNRRSIVKLRDEYEALWGQAIDDGVRTGAFDVREPPLARLSPLQMCTGVAHYRQQ